MPDSESKEYDDQLVIVDGLGITHFIPKRPKAEKLPRKAKAKRPRHRS